jgi:hypothetical protein
MGLTDDHEDLLELMLNVIGGGFALAVLIVVVVRIPSPCRLCLFIFLSVAIKLICKTPRYKIKFTKKFK